MKLITNQEKEEIGQKRNNTDRPQRPERNESLNANKLFEGIREWPKRNDTERPQRAKGNETLNLQSKKRREWPKRNDTGRPERVENPEKEVRRPREPERKTKKNLGEKVEKEKKVEE